LLYQELCLLNLTLHGGHENNYSLVSVKVTTTNRWVATLGYEGNTATSWCIVCVFDTFIPQLMSKLR